MRRRLTLALLAFAVPLLAAEVCGAPIPTYDATIRWTSYGIPHIQAADYRSAAYGYGYAFARDNLCELAEQVTTVNAERALHFGEGSGYTYRSNGSGFINNLNSDFFYGLVMDDAFLQAWYDTMRPKIRRSISGYAAGYNRYLADTGVGNLPLRCRNGTWVRPIDHLDLVKRFYQLLLLASQGFVINGMVGAQPPDPALGNTLPCGPTDVQCVLDLLDPGDFPTPETLGIGSNAYAFGSEATENGRGVLLGNPHFPWFGSERFHQFQLTIPGELNIAGMAIYGVPLALIGFNEGVAWSHTVSTAYRFTPFELQLVPDFPTQYVVDGETLDMTTQEVQVCVAKDGGGSCTDLRSHSFWFSIYGPIFNLSEPVFEWDAVRAYSMRDANASNLRAIDHFFEINRAETTDDVLRILQTHVGIPWVNTIAADSRGKTLYADISVVPNVPDEMLLGPDDFCNATPVGDAVFQLLNLPVLDGRRSACNWRIDPVAPQPGIFSRLDLPFLSTRLDYVMNSNDSYWLSHHTEKLEGFDRIIGSENSARSLRTRLGHRQVIDRLQLDGTAEPDGLPGNRFDVPRLQQVLYSNRNYAGELLRDDLVALCRTPPTTVFASDNTAIDLLPACDVLEFDWDARDDSDSRGAHLFRRWYRYATASANQASNIPLFAVPFNPLDPVNTPHTLNPARDADLKRSLADAVQRITSLGFSLDERLADIQGDSRSGTFIPIHGGPGSVGVFNAINVGTIQSDGYDPIEHGSSYIQTVGWDDEGPVAGTIVTYSQSAEPESPHYSDMTQLYSQKQWVDFPYHEADIAADTQETLHLTE